MQWARIRFTRTNETLTQAGNFLQGGNDQVQLVMPTGSGKTGIIVPLPYFLNKRKVVVVVVVVVVVAPKPDIAEQIAVQFVGPNFSGDNYSTRERDASSINSCFWTAMLNSLAGSYSLTTCFTISHIFCCINP